MTTIYLASTSPEKIRACFNGWSRVVNEIIEVGASFTIKTFDVKSDVSPQPLNDDIRQGALNRIKNLKALEDSKDIYYVAFESGVWVSPEDKFGMEGTVCIIEYNGVCKEVISTRRDYPYFLIREAVEAGITNLKEHNKIVRAWFETAPKSLLSRIEVMTNVPRIKCCLIKDMSRQFHSLQKYRNFINYHRQIRSIDVHMERLSVPGILATSLNRWFQGRNQFYLPYSLSELRGDGKLIQNLFCVSPDHNHVFDWIKKQQIRYELHPSQEQIHFQHARDLHDPKHRALLDWLKIQGSPIPSEQEEMEYRFNYGKAHLWLEIADDSFIDDDLIDRN